MPRRLTALKIREVSSVDRGAGEGVRVVLHKRAPMTKADIDAAIAEYEKISTKERKKAEAKGQTMPGGSFPIRNMDDLEKAIHAYGRAGDKPAAKSWIMRRARELGAADKIPEDWRGKAEKRLAKAFAAIAKALAKSEGGEDFNTELAEMQSLDFGEGVVEAVMDACRALKHSIESIMEDDGTGDKGSAIRDSFGQFLDHVQDIVPKGDVEKSWQRIAKRCRATITKRKEPDVSDMTIEKALEKIGKLEKQVSKHDALIERVVKMSAKHRAYMGHADNDMSDDAKKKFAGMSDEERDDHMGKHPIEKMTEKRMESLPEPLRKQLEAGKASEERLAKFEAERETEVFGKRASDFGLPVEMGKHFAVLAKANPDAWAAVEKAINTLATRSDMAVLFKEFGTSQGTAVGSAMDQLNEKAAELRKTQSGLTEAQAFAKVYEDPANRELVTLEKNARRGLAA